MKLSEAEELFHRALGIESAEERAAFLRSECAGREVSSAQVEALLGAHLEATAFLSSEPTVAASKDTTDLQEAPGTRIGRYKLIQKLGEGGMGVVYMAEQEEPVRRRVALKVIKLGMDTQQVVARFEAERQALALMDHPNIARVLDGGATDFGRPYFVMEMVEGVAITEFCDQRQLNVQSRLRLFIQVCQAIQSAHQKGIIHRDIKPSNVLVTFQDGVPLAKVIDYGIAKATNQRLTEKRVFTHCAMMMGTPAYMSPEQAGTSPEVAGDIDTRADIYSLGVLLYELLTETTPFPEGRLRGLGFGEMQRVIMLEEPERPSKRLGSMDKERSKFVAEKRNVELTTLVSLLCGDLDWIVMRCLEKDRAHRYETAMALADDIERHLRHEPVAARPSSTIYRLGKMVRRRRAPLLAATVVLVTIVTALAFSARAYFRERQAKIAAQLSDQYRQVEARRAEAETTRAEGLHGFVDRFLEKVMPVLTETGDSTLVRHFLNDLEPLARGLSNMPITEARLRLRIGRAYAHELEDPVRAEIQFKLAEVRARSHSASDHSLADLALSHGSGHGDHRGQDFLANAGDFRRQWMVQSG